ncbi:MAG: CRISPR-associated primase-polymerase type A1 [Thermodesulfobacteriota bacterium]
MSVLQHQAKDPQPTALVGASRFEQVFPRLQKEILEGRKPELCGQILNREDIWKGVEPPMQLKWARLAQMAGEVKTALTILAHVNTETPGLKEAWEDRLSLLSILDKESELIAVLAASGEVFGEEQRNAWAGRYGKRTPAPDGLAEAAAAPFERLRHRQDLISHYLDLFSGREDCFARQWVDKAEQKQGYVPVRRPIGFPEVEEHLSGRKTYGIYLVRYDGTVKLAVLDVDLRQEYRGARLKTDDRGLVRREGSYLYSRIRELSAKIGLEPLVEFSGGKGFHFWFLLSDPVTPDQVRKALGEIRDVLAGDLKAFNLEIFPKQEKLSGKGLGNLVKLPLGIHRLTGKRSYFVQCPDRSAEAQIEFLGRAKASSVSQLLQHVAHGKQEKILMHPRLQKWSGDFPELATLEASCPPLGQIIASCRQGRTLSNTEERVLFQTLAFTKRAKTLLHHIMAFLPEYNPHLVDFKLSRLRGGPLGCKRIHSVLGFTADLCGFQRQGEYEHPLLHLCEGEQEEGKRAERVENLTSALDQLKTAIAQVQRFLI